LAQRLEELEARGALRRRALILFISAAAADQHGVCLQPFGYVDPGIVVKLVDQRDRVCIHGYGVPMRGR
jgi:hypothetical protein